MQTIIPCTSGTETMAIHVLKSHKEAPKASTKYVTFFLLRSWIEDYYLERIFKIVIMTTSNIDCNN